MMKTKFRHRIQSPSVVLLQLIFLFFFQCTGNPQASREFEKQREQMVKWQIEARGVTDKRVLDAMRKVERHLFVPAELASYAYADQPLPVGYNQTISQPYIVAFMTEALQLDPGSKVLEIGTGSGYQAAVLAELCDSVFTIEIVEELGTKARSLLKVLHYDNVFVKIGDGYQGWAEYAPFDAIIVTCAPTHVPDPLKEQLVEGGKMIIPVGETNYQELILLIKKKGRLIQQAVLPVRFVPMVDKNKRKY
jgi:protein-L-isoaspartate(D-aspartate) O-methyltransferase